MSRLTHLFAILGLSSLLAGATIAACHSGSPGELPPVAPRPAPLDPSGSPNGAPRVPTPDGGAAVGDPSAPVSSREVRVRELPTPDFAPAAYSAGEPAGKVVGTKAPYDAGTGDGYTPPLPPIPDGGVPIDSRVEPKAQ